MLKCWDDFWYSFLDKEKLNLKISELNIIDGYDKTTQICRNIYDKYDEYSKHLDVVRLKFVQEIEYLPGVHLQTSRVKSIESLLGKIINKRHENLLSKNNLYSTISAGNYNEIITDLVGVRIIIGYRGEWRKLHDAIVSKFPYKTLSEYSDNRFIPHEDSRQFIAEIPKVYYSLGDDPSIYEDLNVKPIIKTSGYRSVHYVISFMNTYIELQTRTIYDEAWSDCDHRYVYKQERNISHAALLNLSSILCKSTNASNDLGDLMHTIFGGEEITDAGDGTFLVANSHLVERINDIASKYKKSIEELDDFRNRLKERNNYDE